MHPFYLARTISLAPPARTVGAKRDEQLLSAAKAGSEDAFAVPSDEGINRYLGPIVSIRLLWLNQRITHAMNVA